MCLNAKQRYLQSIIYSIVLIYILCSGRLCARELVVGSAKTVNLYAGYKDIVYDKDGYVQSAMYEKYSFDDYARTAAHEFGHILGIDDAYPGQNIGRPAATETNEVPEGDMMRNQFVSNLPLTANDVEMAFWAFKTNSFQYFVGYNGHTKSAVVK